MDATGSKLRHARAQWPGRRGKATRILPAGRDKLPKGPQKTAFWFLCRRGQRNPPPGRRNSPFGVLSNNGKNQRLPGAGLRGVPALQSPAPGPPLRGTLPGQPFRASGAGGAADCPRFRAAAAGWAIWRTLSGWAEKARLVHTAVGAGAGSAGGETPPLHQAFQILCGPVRPIPPIRGKWLKAKRGRDHRPLRKLKNVGATAGAVPTFLVRYGRGGETKFRRKFFAKLSFKKAGLLFFQEK